MGQNSLELLRERIKNEPFANHMGISLLDIAPGYAKVEPRFPEKMNSFHGITHGGALFALIDVAFGAASNSPGTVALALNIMTATSPSNDENGFTTYPPSIPP